MTANSFVATIVLVDATKTPLLPHFGALVLGARTDGLARVGTRGTTGDHIYDEAGLWGRYRSSRRHFDTTEEPKRKLRLPSDSCKSSHRAAFDPALALLHPADVLKKISETRISGTPLAAENIQSYGGSWRCMNPNGNRTVNRAKQSCSKPRAENKSLYAPTMGQGFRLPLASAPAGCGWLE
ncbi:hypothetical protein KC338_g110 [Hortaea werneckii]|nr:hypothetical protein KC338_g110 [Hortaea werneckii]